MVKAKIFLSVIESTQLHDTQNLGFKGAVQEALEAVGAKNTEDAGISPRLLERLEERFNRVIR